MTMGFMTPFHGFCMALADSVPGCIWRNGGVYTGLYDHFIGALHDRSAGTVLPEKIALHYLLKLGAGWAIGMGLCVSLLANLFSAHIYFMSSLFLGLTVVSIPFVAPGGESRSAPPAEFPLRTAGYGVGSDSDHSTGQHGAVDGEHGRAAAGRRGIPVSTRGGSHHRHGVASISGSSIAYHKTVFSHLQPGPDTVDHFRCDRYPVELWSIGRRFFLRRALSFAVLRFWHRIFRSPVRSSQSIYPCISSLPP